MVLKINFVLRFWTVLLLVSSPLAWSAELPDFTELVEQQAGAVVNISSIREVSSSGKSNPHQNVPDSQDVPEFFKRFMPQPYSSPRRKQPLGSGSGFIVSSDGFVLTNHHVVDGADQIVVRLSDRREMDAELIGSDPKSDLALLKIDAQDLPVVKLGKSDELRVGEWVLAIGSPFGFEYSVTAGIVSAKGRSLPSSEQGDYVPYIQTDVAINPGNSGGPLFNLEGKVVGINSQIYTRSGGFMGLSFAIPIDVAMEVVEQLKTTGEVSRGWLGVLIQNVNRELAESFGLERAAGALVAEVQPDGPADEGGLKAGDIILKFNGSEINLSSDLPHVVGRTPANSKATVELVRNGKAKTLTFAIGELPDAQQKVASRPGRPDQPAGPLGMEVADVPESAKQRWDIDKGVVVKAVKEGAAALAGIRRGDVLTMINGEWVQNVLQFGQLIEQLPAGRSVPVRILRNGSASFLAIRIPE